MAYRTKQQFHRIPNGRLIKSRYHMKRSSYKRKRIGMPVGGKHNWKYIGQWRETKIAPRLWKFRFRATKSRGGSSRGGLKVGGKMVWAIQGIQTARKTGGRKYLTDFRGIKKQLGYSYDGKKIKWNIKKRKYN